MLYGVEHNGPEIPLRHARPGLPHEQEKLHPSPRLRRDAEAELVRVPPAEAPIQLAAELLHELQVHQIELEMQNEALRQSQIVLEESRDRYVDLYEFAPVGYLTLSRQGQIASINLTGAALLGEDRGKLIQRRFAHLVAAGEQETWQSLFLKAFQTDEKQHCELSLLRLDGTVIVVSADCLHTTAGNTAPMLRMALSDITERRDADLLVKDANERLANLAVEQAAHLREMAGELTYAEQRERDHFYELLHDEVQPLLVAARLSLSSLSERTPPHEALRVAAEACRHISQVIQVARTLSLQLSPPLIRERGLNPALESLCRWVKANQGLEVDLITAADTEPDDVALRLLCFNAVRELLMNVVKHANTAHAALTLDCDDPDHPDNLRITLRDRGRGFDPKAITNGSGLAAMTRRLDVFGGSLQVQSEPGHGSVATISVPIRPVTAVRAGHASQERRRKEG
jgi:PAS domain S-box-containing protein